MKWQYLQMATSSGKLDAELARLGEDGWELAAAAPGAVATGLLATKPEPGFLLIFKRPVSDDQRTSNGVGSVFDQHFHSTSHGPDCGSDSLDPA